MSSPTEKYRRHSAPLSAFWATRAGIYVLGCSDGEPAELRSESAVFGATAWRNHSVHCKIEGRDGQ